MSDKKAVRQTKIFLDSSDPAETALAINYLGFLDGQTTNPTLVSKNPLIKACLANKKITPEELLMLYQQIIQKVAQLIPNGSISIEVHADSTTTAEKMLEQARLMNNWTPNPHIKFPITKEGIGAAKHWLDEGGMVNMTLCFTQEQAAAVYTATRGAKRGQVFLSPFIGRLDDQGECGLDLLENILQMYKQGDGHVEVLTASIRNINHLDRAVKLGSDIITAPLQVLKEWAIATETLKLQPIHHKPLDLNLPWSSFMIDHNSTTNGLKRFADDWNHIIYG